MHTKLAIVRVCSIDVGESLVTCSLKIKVCMALKNQYSGRENM